ncbi:MAG: hypothetical protein N4A61_04365 [Pelagimonas sp.]|nr:hypothetical protein [Pelagimonas sp.]
MQQSEMLLARGRHLARQEGWDSLVAEIQETDQARRLTPGLRLQAELLSQGAREDAVSAARSAAHDNAPERAMAAIKMLETALSDYPGSLAVTQVVVMAHVDTAEAWRGHMAQDHQSDLRANARKAHLARATELLDQFDPFQQNSALYAKARCALLSGDPNPRARLQDDYEDLIELDPRGPEHMMHFGRDLLPDHYGSWEMLDVMARRTYRQVRDIWGTGAYSWVYLGALQQNADAARRLETDLFVEGLHDILQRNHDQHVVNLLAAFTGYTLAQGDHSEANARRLADCFNWIARDHLHEIHPRIWADAPSPCQGSRPPRGLGGPPFAQGDATGHSDLGSKRALSTLAQHFEPVLSGEQRVYFRPEGIKVA